MSDHDERLLAALKAIIRDLVRQELDGEERRVEALESLGKVPPPAKLTDLMMPICTYCRRPILVDHDRISVHEGSSRDGIYHCLCWEERQKSGGM